MTHFIYTMLELIRTAQSSMLERLQSNIEHFETVQKNCMEYFEQNSLSKKERKRDCFRFSSIRPLRHGLVSYLEFDRRHHRTRQADNKESSKEAWEQRHCPSRFKEAFEIQTYSRSRRSTRNLIIFQRFRSVSRKRRAQEEHAIYITHRSQFADPCK